jgi:N-acetylglutamate synthase-like GNAT family acetyltransferase
MAGIDKSVTQGLLEVKSVKTDRAQRRQGHASKLMEQVCKEADESKTILVLTPAQFDNGPIGTQQLKWWYERFGFAVIQEKPILMCRDPLVSLEQVAVICESFKEPLRQRYDIESDTLREVSEG